MQTDRKQLIEILDDQQQLWDVIIVGGGATGLGTAVDAASRGLKTLLLEQADFAKGTSSRSTKLVHGGVRYLAQGNIGLVREALYERGLLLKNAAHLVKNEVFVIPNYTWWSGPFYTIGLSVYDLLAGKLGFGRARHLSRTEIVNAIPTINQQKLHGGVSYHDGQFDDSRLAVNLAQTALEQGATVLNYFRVEGLVKDVKGKISGVRATDNETGKQYTLKSRSVVNATGVFVDELLQDDQPGRKSLVRSSQGIHLVVDRSFMPADQAIMIPHTEDGRVLFMVPWHDKLVLGTTDTPLNEHRLEPVALEEEIDFVLRTTATYLLKAPLRKDVLSVFAGLRPLAAPEEGSTKTKEISRSHKLLVSKSGLITMTGGKWTTYRRMAEDTVNQIYRTAQLPPENCKTKNLPIHGSQTGLDVTQPLSVYGTDLPQLLKLAEENPVWKTQIHPRLPFIQAQVIWAVRHEMARTVEDVLARRIRMLFLDARAAIDSAAGVAALMAKELNYDLSWEDQQKQEFVQLAQNYLLEPYQP
ncbi:FAD-dependent oxidoreductase [Pedobacter antarcticus 4BY]|uniref:FAD-dependent oxidoreductase n=2 Tax=Pedobacter antarcticus TaxID=34086 RepID=A0A081PFX5_9SPHI|nr:glycerol-3-phosphate dehydrogenase/oxidase [Pedobacter antarcticus]KEQ29598.1 FAD-dependent oxidoreductase [Pedobacter antarcticus 4BY]SFE93544.1 glycerol-3-phosphate dehydrogenase [Pedobacter antarcticus]